MTRSVAWTVLLTLLAAYSAAAQKPKLVDASVDANRLTYLDERDPYYPHASLARLTTPQWVGEEDVEAVILLSVDDMGGPPFQPRYDVSSEAFLSFLKPLVERLQAIDGRAPIAVMTCQARSNDPTATRMLNLGMSLDCHTFTHRFPFLRFDKETSTDGDTLRECRDDYMACLENLLEIPANRPVAHRLPGCDAQNTNSPRFYSEVFPLRAADGRFLSCDTSVMTWFSSDDESLPDKLRFDSLGRKRFEKYVFNIPQTKHFVNHIRDYPYPYVINNLLWELPVTIPCDSHGVHQNEPANEKTVDDWKRTVDICVRKQGLCTLLFHTIGYIGAEQLADVIDYADVTYGHRVKFLNCREIDERLTEQALGGIPLRSPSGGDNGVRMLDVNADGFMDFVIGNSARQETRVWDPSVSKWRVLSFPNPIVAHEDTENPQSTGVRFWVAPGGNAGFVIANDEVRRAWSFTPDGWQPMDRSLPEAIDGSPFLTAEDSVDRGVRFRDINRDGVSDLIVNNDSQNAVYLWSATDKLPGWRRAPYSLPEESCLVDASGADQGLRFIDLNGDRFDDLVFANEDRYWVRLFESERAGWSRETRRGFADHPDALPPIVRDDGLGGVWFHSGAMIEENEFTTPSSRDFIRRIPFDDLISQDK